MQGMMMNRPLKISDIITYSAENHSNPHHKLRFFGVCLYVIMAC